MVGRPKGSSNKPKEDKLDKILDLLGTMNARIEQLEQGEKEIEETSATLIEKGSKNKQKKKAVSIGDQPPKRPNLFDSMPESKGCKKDKIFDKKVWAGREPTERREPVAMVDINCSGCGQRFSINPAYITKPYKCNDCLTGGGR